MSDPKSKSKNQIQFEAQAEHASRSPSFRTGRDKSIVRKVNPLGFRVLVSVLKEEDISAGGLFLPEGAKESMQESLLAKVLEVASATDHDTQEEANVSGIPHGALVLIPKSAGIRIPWDSELRIVESKEILALVSEICVV